MIPPLDGLGRLPPGIHPATWDEVAAAFGGTAWRDRLLSGLHQAITSLKRAGGGLVYIDGSFVTAKTDPGDFDACWEEVGVDPNLLDLTLLDFSNKRAAQKAKFGGELFPASIPADPSGISFLRFFQVDRATGDAKGIVAIDLRGWQP